MTDDGLIFITSPYWSHIGEMKSEETLVKAAEMALKKREFTKRPWWYTASNEAGNDFWERLDYIIRDDLYYRNKSLNAENK